MNKEFKKLLEVSYTKGFEECARTGHKVGDLDVIFNSIVMGEFAELIVRECANHCDLLLDHKISSEWSRGTHDCSKAIKKHFGVEE